MVANLGTPNILYINSGDGGLERTTVGDFASMMADAAGTMITMDIKASDVDGDGDLDVIVANEEVWQISGAGFGIAGARTGAMLYLNDGDGIFCKYCNTYTKFSKYRLVYKCLSKPAFTLASVRTGQLPRR